MKAFVEFIKFINEKSFFEDVCQETLHRRKKACRII